MREENGCGYLQSHPSRISKRTRKSGSKPFALIVTVGLMIVFGPWSCSPRGSGAVQPLTIGSSHNEADTLIYIAYEQGFFTGNGLSVTIKDYASGMAAVNAMLNGEVDVATASEYVIVQNAFKKQAISSMGVISESYGSYLVGRTDRGVRNVADLEGKKVGVPVGTLAQFYLGRFLAIKGMSGKPITFVNTDIAQTVDALANGDVDAVMTWEPYLSRIKERLGDRIIAWSAHSEQPQYKNVTAPRAWPTQHPDVAKRFLRSLADAERFVALNPEQAKAIIQKKLQYDDEYMGVAWPLNEFSLSLSQSLLLAMEDEARWMVENNLTTERNGPDFRDYIYVDALEAIDPQAVNIR
jgi:NitT/TauT family transport system substrate-binding protein